METVLMHVLEEAGNSLETRSDKSFMIMRIDWNAHMQHDVDKSELNNFKHRTLDRSEWGAYEQIILWSKIYQIKIE
eukprot:1269649-Heterocapsa_arctica.AAC.1